MKHIKKRFRTISFLIILFLLFLVGCQAITALPSGVASGTEGPDQTTSATDATILTTDPSSQPTNVSSDPTVESTQPTAETTQPTQPTSEPTEESTEPTQPSDDILYEMYVWHPDEIYVFDYTEGEQPYGGPGEVFDLSKLNPGHLYVNNISTDTLTHITGPVTEWAITLEHLYFILDAEPTKVYRTNYQGEEKVMLVDIADIDLFDGVQTINSLTYAGTDAYGKLLFEVDSQKVIQYDLKDRSARLLMEQEYIHYFYYLYPGQWGYPGKGPKLHWIGYDEDGKLVDYFYFIETGENIRWWH